MLASSCLLCVATFTGARASYPVPDCKVHITALRMYVPTAVASCVIDTVATTYAAVLQPAKGPVAPASPVAVDGGNEYLALLHSMTCPDERRRRLVSQLGNVGEGNDKLTTTPSQR